jgi:Zn-dependent protease with chaperone function
MAKAAGAAVGCLTTAVFLVIWAADVVSCFGGRPGSGPPAGDGPAAGAALRPRELSASDPFERTAARDVTDGWGRLGLRRSALDLWIVDSDDINAASFGNGRFVIWRGLRRLPPEAQHAIYAHEFAHDQLRHGKKTSEMADVANWLGEVFATFSGGDEGMAETLKHWTGQLVMPRYSRQQELEADREAIRLLGLMGYAAPDTVMCRALKLVRDEVGEAGGGLFASHPSMSARIEHVAGGGC